MIASLTDRELAQVLAALRLYQRLAVHSADLCDVATDGGSHEPMSPDEVDDLCERLNLGTTVRQGMQGLPTMVVQNDGETWSPLSEMELVFLPEETDDYCGGCEAGTIVADTVFAPPSGVFDLERLLGDLPMQVLEAYRLVAGKKPEGAE